jgi:putative alpha-1,2-mannosidase
MIDAATLSPRDWVHKGHRCVRPATSDTNRYVQSAELNGKKLARAWLKHSEIAAGGPLVLRMGPAPLQWGREERPPSVTAR